MMPLVMANEEGKAHAANLEALAAPRIVVYRCLVRATSSLNSLEWDPTEGERPVRTGMSNFCHQVSLSHWLERGPGAWERQCAFMRLLFAPADHACVCFSLRGRSALHFHIPPWSDVRLPAELKHIIKRRRRKQP